MHNLSCYMVVVILLLRPVLVYLFPLLVDSKPKNAIIQKLLLIPAIINALVAFSALFCKISFYYTESNVFMRGPLGYLPVYTLIFYFTAVIIYEIKVSYKENPYEIVNVFACVLVCLVALVIQIETGESSVGRIAIMYSMMFYYMFFQIKQYKIQTAKEKFKAEHDALSGLMNRVAFNRYIEEYSISKDTLLFILIDVDNFKLINDTHGHEIGDFTLMRVGELLKNEFRKSDLIFRIGGDEFAILIASPQETLITKAVSEKIATINLQLKKQANGLPKTSISAGVAFSQTGYSNHLYDEADQALYYTKNTLRGGCTIYNDELSHAAMSHTN